MVMMVVKYWNIGGWSGDREGGGGGCGGGGRDSGDSGDGDRGGGGIGASREYIGNYVSILREYGGGVFKVLTILCV